MSDLTEELAQTLDFYPMGSFASKCAERLRSLQAEVDSLTKGIDENLWIEKWPIAKENAALRIRNEELRAEIEGLTAEMVTREAESMEWEDRLATLLKDTANALHGGPLANGLWSWHDLPVLAAAERALADKLAMELRVWHDPAPLSGSMPCPSCEALIEWKNARQTEFEAERNEGG